MVIIFYDASTEEVYVCSSRHGMKKFTLDDTDLLSNVPNDDILYVSNGHLITKQQFGDWLSGDLSLEDSVQIQEKSEVETNDKYHGKKFLHPVRNGAILIPDIKTDKYPEGVEMIGKYSFVCLDDLGGTDVLEESIHCRLLLSKGKIEVVDWNYVKQHQNKASKASQRDAYLDSILIKNDTKGSAEAVASAGGLQDANPISGADAVEIFVGP